MCAVSRLVNFLQNRSFFMRLSLDRFHPGVQMFALISDDVTDGAKKWCARGHLKMQYPYILF